MTGDGILSQRLTTNLQSPNPSNSINDIATTQPDDTKETESDIQYNITLEDKQTKNVVAPDALTERTWRRRRRIQFITLCWVFILEGWNDSSIGPLLDRIQGFYWVSSSKFSIYRYLNPQTGELRHCISCIHFCLCCKKSPTTDVFGARLIENRALYLVRYSTFTWLNVSVLERYGASTANDHQVLTS